LPRVKRRSGGSSICDEFPKEDWKMSFRQMTQWQIELLPWYAFIIVWIVVSSGIRLTDGSWILSAVFRAFGGRPAGRALRQDVPVGSDGGNCADVCWRGGCHLGTNHFG